MIDRIKKIKNAIGIDRAIIYTILSRAIQAGGGVVSIIFIAKYLTKIEQGYYFTFGSILAIQIFFELGLSNIIIQFVAHERALLEWGENNSLVGPEKALSRLSSLLKFCTKWFFLVGILLIIVLLIVGYYFFNKYGQNQESISWVLPWVVMSISSGCSLMISPILAFLEGLGKVEEVAKLRLVQQGTYLIVLYTSLIFGLKLLSSPVAATTIMLMPLLWIFFSKNKDVLKFIWGQLTTWKVTYKLEIFPYQWRIALSWISGYFIFQLFNPVLFATEGALVAGQMGMTLAGLNGILALSLSWVNTKVPLFSNYIARKEYFQLDNVFDKTVKQATIVCTLCLLLFIGIVYTLQYLKIPIGNRFLPILPLVMLSATTIINQYIAAIATYLRCHKQEPFLIQSIVTGVLVATSTFVFGKMFGLMGIVTGYTLITVTLSLLWALFIFKTKKKEWHQ